MTTAIERFPAPPCARLLGWRLLAASAEDRRVTVAFEAKPDFCNPAVIVASDGALYGSTIDMTVSFLAPARPGRLVGEGVVIQLGRSIGFVEGKLSDADGALIARASASVRLTAIGKAVRGPA